MSISVIECPPFLNTRLSGEIIFLPTNFYRILYTYRGHDLDDRAWHVAWDQSAPGGMTLRIGVRFESVATNRLAAALAYIRHFEVWQDVVSGCE